MTTGRPDDEGRQFDNAGSKRLIVVDREGVKMEDPCQKRPGRDGN